MLRIMMVPANNLCASSSGPPRFAAEVRSGRGCYRRRRAEMAEKRLDDFRRSHEFVWDVYTFAESIHVV